VANIKGSKKLTPYDGLRTKSVTKTAIIGAIHDQTPFSIAPEIRKRESTGEKLNHSGWDKGM